MFDKHFVLDATDGSAALDIVGGTEGLKSLTVIVAGKNYAITPQKLIDLAAPQLVAWSETQP